MADTTLTLADLHLQFFQSGTIQYEVPFTDIRYAKVASCVFKEKGRSDSLHILVSSLTEATKQAIWTVNFRMTDDGQYTLDETSSFLQYSREYWHPEDFYLCYSPDPANSQCNIELYFKHERGKQSYRFVALTVLSDVDRTTPTDWTFHDQTYETSLRYLPVDGWTRVSTVTDAPVKIQYPRLIDGINFDGSANIFHFGYSSTEPGTKIKLVSCPGFILTEGAEITVFFAKSNTAASPSLDVEGTGAKPIYRDGEVMPAGEIAYETVLRFVYYKNRWNTVSHANGKGILYKLADHQDDGLFSAADKRKLDTVEWNANYYILPPATKATLGGVKIGDDLTIQADGTLSMTSKNICDALGYVPVRIEQVPVGATALPLVADETPKVGTSGKWAREDHVHPIQIDVPGNAGSATTVKQTAVAVATSGTIPKYPLLISAIPTTTSRTSGSNESVLYDLATSVTGRGDLEIGSNLLVKGGEVRIAQASAGAGRLIFDQASSKKGVEIIEQDGVLTFQGVAPTATGPGYPLAVDFYKRTVSGGYTITGTLKGNADTATEFKSTQIVKITGAATGQASSTAGWTVDITLRDSGVAAGTYGQATNVNVGNQDATVSVSIPYITVDQKGLVTSLTHHTFTTPAWYTSTPKEVALIGNAGSSRTFAKGDHVHAFPTSGVTAGEYGPTGNSTPGFGATFKVPYYKVDDRGRITKAVTYTTTIPATLATPTVIGLVSTEAQSFAGAKTFNNGIVLNQSTISMTARDADTTTLRTNAVLQANSANNAYGINVALGGSGNTVVGGGESAGAQLVDLAGNQGEDLYLVADGSIYLKVSGNDWTKAKTVTLDTSTHLSGLAKVTATTFVGELDGNAKTATTLKNTRTLWGQSFNGSGNVSGAMSGVGTITHTAPTAGSSADLLYSAMAANDYFRVTVGGASDAGWAELATGDNGNEPIYIRQYNTNGVAKEAVILDGSGNTILPGTVTANKFVGPLTGNVTGSVTVPANGKIYVPSNATLEGDLKGNADTASQFLVARKINETTFNGTENITTDRWGKARNIYIADSSATNTGVAVSVNGAGDATLKLPATIKATLKGNADTATKAAQLTTARTINLSEAVTGSISFDGSANVTIAASLKTCYAVVEYEAVPENIFKFATFNVANAYNSYNVHILIQSPFGTGSALWQVYISAGSTAGMYAAGSSTLIHNVGLDATKFFVGYKSNSGGSINVALYCKIDSRYYGYKFTVISETRRTPIDSGSGSALVLTNKLTTRTQVSGTTAIDSGYTLITTTNAKITGDLDGNASSATKLAVARSLWGNSFDGTANVSGTITGAPSIELFGTSNSNHGGFIDFHYNGDTHDYTSRIIESAAGILTIPGQLCLTRTTDASATADNGPALRIGAIAGTHLEFDTDEIMAKTKTTAGVWQSSTLYLNYDGGQVYIGPGGLNVGGGLRQKHPDYVYGTTHRANKFWGLSFNDKNELGVADILFYQNTSGNGGGNALEFRIFGNPFYSTSKPTAQIGCAIDQDGTRYGFCDTHPSTRLDNNVIATTAWVRAATGNTSLNAATATQFASAQKVTLTGDVTGEASSQAGWSVSTTLKTITNLTAGSYGPSADANPAHEESFSVPYITIDDKGRVVAASTKTITLPAGTDIVAQVMTGATASRAGTAGLVPAPSRGDQAKVLSGAGTWVTNTGDTHYTTRLYVGKSDGNVNAATTNNNTYLMILDVYDTTSIVRDRKLIKGTGATTVASDENGAIIINSTNTTYTAATATPLVAGTAAAGTSTQYARADHVHPAQTTITGNAATATKFKDTQKVTLTGDVTGEASSQAGWSVSTTLKTITTLTAGSYGPSKDVEPGYGTTFNVPYITVDAKGRVTAASTKTVKIPASDNTDAYVLVTQDAGPDNWTKIYLAGSKAIATGRKQFYARGDIFISGEKAGRLCAPEFYGSLYTPNSYAEVHIGTNGATITGPLTLSRTTDIGGTKDAAGALRIGDITGKHLAFDGSEIMAKADATTVSPLYLNNDGGLVVIGSGGLRTSQIDADGALTIINGGVTLNHDNESCGDGLTLLGANQDFAISIVRADIEKGTDPSATKHWDIDFYGKTATSSKNRIGKLECLVDKNSTSTVKLTAFCCASNVNTTVAELKISIDKTGVATTYAPTPPAASNTTHIATTEWVRAYAPVMKGAEANKVGIAGLVPAPPKGSQSTKFLRADGTWQIPPVTSSSGTAVQNTDTTYELKLSGRTLTLKGSDGHTDSVPLPEDKDTVYEHPTGNGFMHIPADGSSGQILWWSSEGTAEWGDPPASSGSSDGESGSSSGSSSGSGSSTSSDIQIRLSDAYGIQTANSGKTLADPVTSVKYKNIKLKEDIHANHFYCHLGRTLVNTALKGATKDFQETAHACLFFMDGIGAPSKKNRIAGIESVYYGAAENANQIPIQGYTGLTIGLYRNVAEENDKSTPEVQGLKFSCAPNDDPTLRVQVPTHFTKITTAEHPADEDESRQIATTGWVMKNTPFLRYDGAKALWTYMQHKDTPISMELYAYSGDTESLNARINLNMDLAFSGKYSSLNTEAPGNRKIAGFHVYTGAPFVSSWTPPNGDGVGVSHSIPFMNTSGPRITIRPTDDHPGPEAGLELVYVPLHLSTGFHTSRVSVLFRHGGLGEMFGPSNSYADNGNNANDYGTVNLGGPSHLWKQVFAKNTDIGSSDIRLKENIKSIPDEILDVWDALEWKQFQWKECVEKEGNAARLHTGLVAQEVEALFQSRSLDVTRYSFFCHNPKTEYVETVEVSPAEYDEAGNMIKEAVTKEETRTVEDSDTYALRYTDILIIEAAYQRRRADRLEKKVEELEARLAKLEALLSK